ncbi:hypothetical protein [Halococcus sp. IIIV-5B]|uniref:hypothetical protein n=1 Tax=Halococcus sp. IIIV-5B TaxID=2321230 RepID=UPI001F38FEA2|nr:hypothetical protein [Halococcus sp. IIIV-5B]
MSMSNVSEDEKGSVRNPGVAEVLREGVSLAIDLPVLYGLYLMIGLGFVIWGSVGGVVSLIVTALGTLVVYRGMGKDIDTERSLVVLVVYAYLAGLIADFLGLVGIFMLVIPGIYLTLRFQFTTAAVMLEEQGPFGGLRRSLAISEGNLWTIFGVGSVFFVVSLVCWGGSILATGGVPTGPTGEVLQRLSQQIAYGSVIQSILVGPVQVCCTVYMYEAFQTEQDLSQSS